MSIASRFPFPSDPLAEFFDAPSAERSEELIQARFPERYKDRWRAQRTLESCASRSDNPVVLDNGTERAMHDMLVSASFAFHPLYGTGHVLRTNGVVAMFWNREEVALVEVKNLTFLRVVLAGERAESPRKRRIAAAMLAD